MNFKKFIKVGLSLFVMVLFTGVISAQTTYYVDNQFGNNANSGLAGSPVADVAHALAAAPAGSIISIAKTPIDYADGNVTITDTYTLTSSGGTPIFTSALLIVNATGKTVTLSGPLEFDGGLTLTAGTLAGGTNLTVKGTVTRTDVGSVTGQLNYAAATNFVYDNTNAAAKTITTGPEFPVDATNANNLTTTTTGGGAMTLKLDQSRTINGLMTLIGGMDLNAMTLTLNNKTVIGAHSYGADITNGTLAFGMNNSTAGLANASINSAFKLPNVTVTTTGSGAQTLTIGAAVTALGNSTVSAKASLTANIAGNAGNVTLEGSGAVILNVAPAGSIGDALAASASTGNVTLDVTGAGALTVKSMMMSGTGVMAIGGVATSAAITNDITLNSTIPAFTNGTGAAVVANKAQINIPAGVLVNVTVGGNVTNSAVFSGTTDQTANNLNGVISFLNTGTLAITKTVSLNITGSVATTAAAGSTTNNNGLILLNSAGAVTTGDVENKSTITLTKGTGSTITVFADIVAAGAAGITATKNITNSTSVFFAADCHNIDFSASAANLAVTGSVTQTGATKGGDILFGNGNLAVSVDIMSDRGDTGADVIDGTAGAGTLSAKNITNSGKSALTFVGTGAVSLTAGLNSSGTGTISFANLAGTFIAKTFAISSGTVDLGTGNAGGNISANGTVMITGGTVYFGTNARNCTFSGSIIQLGSATTRPTLRASAGTLGTGTDMIFAEPVPNVNQTISFGLLETVWPGNFSVSNSATLPAPYVIFNSVDAASPGAIRVVGGTVKFNTTPAAVYNTVQLDNARIFIGQNNVSGVGGSLGDFDNVTGYETINNGFVMMSGGPLAGAAQVVNATGAADASVHFGNFGVDNNTGTAPCVTFTTPATFAGDFYLATGQVSNVGVVFNGATPYPTIYRTLGTFAAGPTFTSYVNVTYYGGDKVTSVELPTAANKLWNLMVATTNGAQAGKGILTLAGNATVNGTLTILTNQSLYTATNTLVLNGASVVIDGNLVDDGATRVQVSTAAGIAFTGTGALPSIQINNGSLGNTLVGYKGIYSQAFGTDGVWGGAGGAADDFTVADGNITFQAGADAGSSLLATFTAPATGQANFGSLTMAGNDVDETFTLGANAVMSGSITLGDNATTSGGTIALGDFTLTHQGTAFSMTKGTKITSSASGWLAFTTTGTNLTFTVGATTVDANVAFNTGGTINAPLTQDATINGMVKLVDQTVAPHTTLNIPNGMTLTCAGSDLMIGDASNITTPATGILKLNRATGWLTLTAATTTIPNVTVSDSVKFAGKLVASTPGTLTVSTALAHSGGELDFGTANIQVNGTFTRTGGTYMGDGWLIWNGTAGNFKHSNIAAAGAMTINNLQVKAALVLQDKADLNVIKGLYLNGANLTNQVGGTGGGYVKMGDASNVPMIRVNGVSTVAGNALTFVNANADYTFEGAALTVDKLYWPLTATLARDVTLNMAAAGNNVTLGADNTINRNVTLNAGTLGWDKGVVLTLGSGSIITRTELGSFDKNNTLNATKGVLTAPSVNLIYIPSTPATAHQAIANGIEYSDPVEVKDLTLGAASSKFTVTVTMTPARTVTGTVNLINGSTPDVAILTFLDNTTFSAAQNISSGTINVVGGTKKLTLSNTGASTLPAVTGNLDAAGDLTLAGNYVGGTLNASGTLTLNGTSSGTINVVGVLTVNKNSTANVTASDNVTIGANGTITGSLTFIGTKSVTLTVPAAGVTVTALTLNKTNNNNTIILSGGNLTSTGLTTFINGLFVTGANTFNMWQPLWGGGQGFNRAGVTGTNISHVVGNVAKTTVNTGVAATSSESRIEFPIGTNTLYRPVALTFGIPFLIPTVPNATFTVNQVNSAPAGAVALPIKDGVADGIDVARYPNFYWNIKSNPSIGPDKPFDMELTATGFTDFDDINNVRIIRRHGTIADESNQWLLQGTNTAYDNESVAGVPTATVRGANAGLRAGGAIFTLGISSNMSVKNPIEKQWLVLNDGAKKYELGGVFEGNIGSLAYTAQSSNTAIATVSVSGSKLTITPVAIGDAVVTIIASDAANNDFFAFSFDINVGLTDVATEEIPTEFALYQNFPNPFNPTTNIKFDLPKESNVTVRIFNILGEEVTTLVNKVMPAGKYNVEFNASKLSSGMYIYRIEADNFVQVKKMLLMK